MSIDGTISTDTVIEFLDVILTFSPKCASFKINTKMSHQYPLVNALSKQ